MATLLSESEINGGISGHSDAEIVAFFFGIVVVLILKAVNDFAEVVIKEKVFILLSPFEVMMKGLLYDGHEDIRFLSVQTVEVDDIIGPYDSI
jgi:pyruvate/2-oxoacid:ferredoxin oxidoreductase alpha subunit